jgi:hypothetical protein
MSFPYRTGTCSQAAPTDVTTRHRRIISSWDGNPQPRSLLLLHFASLRLSQYWSVLREFHDSRDTANSLEI